MTKDDQLVVRDHYLTATDVWSVSRMAPVKMVATTPSTSRWRRSAREVYRGPRLKTVEGTQVYPDVSRWATLTSVFHTFEERRSSFFEG